MALDPLRIPAASLARPTTMFATPAMITVRRVALCPLRLFTEDNLPERAASNHACRDTRREISSARSLSGIHIGHMSAPRPPARHAHEAAGTGMADATADQVRRYVLDSSDDDLRRLLSLSESFAEHARRALRRVGVGPGWTVIDCGCGPIGGLAILAEMVGPAGRVVGVDFSEPAVQRARSVVAALELGNVELFAGDIHELGPAAVGGPFDLAYARLFLMHQPDPVRTLSHIASLLRPGGWVVAQEALRSPPPQSHPHLDALSVYWDLVYDLLERAGGVPRHAVDGLAGSARA